MYFLYSEKIPYAVLTGVLALCLFFGTFAQYAKADGDEAPPLENLEQEKESSFSAGTRFFDDSTINAALYYFQRKRDRYDYNKGEFRTNLDHATTQASAEFNSGFIGGFLGADVGVYGSLDLYNNGAPDHEMNFVPWANPWHPDWNANHTDNGVSIYKANLKAKYENAWAKAGYFQPSGPGVLGVNWSFLPGSYLGVETGVDLGGLSLAGAMVSQYKAPWYKEFYHFEDSKGDRVDYLWSLGAKYKFDSGISMELAYGESEHFLKNAQFKFGYSTDLGPGKINLGYNLYAMDDKDNSGSVNDLFDGVATQHFLYSNYTISQWTFKAEFTYTSAPQSNNNQLGYFAYRLVVPNGGAKGAYEAWWDNRSDWNHDNEKAAFAGVSRNFSDFNLPGLSAGLSASIGWDGEAYGVAEHLQESAWSADLGYTIQSGPLKNSSIKAHYTKYYNGTSQPSWVGFKNAFQNENDFKLLMIVPFSIKGT